MLAVGRRPAGGTGHEKELGSREALDTGRLDQPEVRAEQHSDPPVLGVHDGEVVAGDGAALIVDGTPHSGQDVARGVQEVSDLVKSSARSPSSAHDPVSR